MKARFQLQRLNEVTLECEPTHGDEAILAAAFIRYDANQFTVSVERYEDGQIKTLTFIASQS
jgi:hypothetical protein